MKGVNVLNWKFWLYLVGGAVLVALLMPLVLEGQESQDVKTLDIITSSTAVEGETMMQVGGKTEVKFTDEERMSVKDKQAEYWRLQAQAASILLQAEKLQFDLSNEVRAMQARCQESDGRFDPGMVSCIEVQSVNGDGGK